MKPGEGPLALLLAMKKGKSKATEPDDEDDEPEDVDGLLREAFSAMREKDEEGFIASMRAAIKGCSEE